MAIRTSYLRTWSAAALAALLVASLLLVLPGSNTAWAAFPGKNGVIALSSQNEGTSTFSIYSINPDGSGATQLTTPTTSNQADVGSSFSAKGDKIVFSSNRDEPSGMSLSIYTMNADGSGVSRLTTPAPDTYEASAAFSPDGSEIVYAKQLLGSPIQIYKMKADGTNQINLSNDSQFSDADPVFSPDGSQIAFVRQPANGGDRQVWAMNADGSNPKQLTNMPGNYAYIPDFSPDGGQIAFTGFNGSHFQIWVMKADGTGLTQLTNDSHDRLGSKWSPDGTQIAFQYFDSNGAQVAVMKSDGTGQTILTGPSQQQNTITNANAIVVSWQPLPSTTLSTANGNASGGLQTAVGSGNASSGLKQAASHSPK